MQRNAAVKFIIDLFFEPERRDYSLKRVWRKWIDPLFHVGYATSLSCRKNHAPDFDNQRFIALLRSILNRYDQRQENK